MKVTPGPDPSDPWTFEAEHVGYTEILREADQETAEMIEALAASDENTLKNLILGNLADTFRGRAPLTPPGTSEEELVGPQAWVNYLLPFLPVIKSQRLLWAAVDGDMVCGKAYLGIAQGSNDADTPYKRLRLIDCWKFDPTTGKIIEQENHYDPRPAIPPSS